MQTISSYKTFYWKASAILLLGWVLRLWKLGDASLWVDEVITDNWMKLPVGTMFSTLLDDVVHMPLYFLIMRLFPTQTELLLRLPSALIGLLSIAVIMAVTLRLYRSRRVALWSGLLLASNPLHVWLSRNARPYSLLFLFALLTSAYFLMLLRGSRTRQIWLIFVLSSAAAYYTHFFALLLPLAQLWFARHFFSKWLLAQVLACLPSLVVLPNLFFAVFLGSGTSGFEEHVSWIHGPNLLDPLLTMTNMAVGYDGRPFNMLILPGLIAAAVGLLLGIRQNRYWLAVILIPLLIIFALSQIQSLYMDRYFIIFLPAVLMLMLSGWQRMPHYAAGLVVLTGLGFIIIDLYDGTFRRHDWREAAAFIEDNYQAGDAIAFNDETSFLHYYDKDRWASTYFFDVNTTSKAVQIHDFSELPSLPVKRIWVVYGIVDQNPSAHKQGRVRADPLDRKGYWLTDWLDEHHNQIISQRTFNGVSVFLVDIKTSPPPPPAPPVTLIVRAVKMLA